MTCQNCKTDFTIDDTDREFYTRIGVPPPTFCPSCRMQRRLATLNIFHLYKRPCDLCKKDSVSMYAPDAPYVVYCSKCWWSDQWDSSQYAKDYDFSRPFFEQFDELLRTTPLLGLSIDTDSTRTSPYTNHAGHLKNCYMLFQAESSEECAYGFYGLSNRRVMDCSLITLSEQCYDSMHSYKCNGCIGSRSQVAESIDCLFLKDCSNCQNCFASANLRNKKYYIFNKPYSKEAYFAEIAKYDLGSYATYQEVKQLAQKHWSTQIPKSEFNEFVTNCSGQHLFNSKNLRDSAEVWGAEDSRYLFMVWAPPVKNCYDITSWGNNMADCYEGCVVGENVSRVLFCQESGINLMDAQYCKLATGGAHLLGCVSTRAKEYCILNRQYPKEEYEALIPKIIEHMSAMPYTDKQGRTYRYGEFFPIELSPFSYNETAAVSFFPQTVEEVLHEGYRWREDVKGTYTITKPAMELPDHIKDAPDSIAEEVIGCAACGRGFRIIPFELNFLRRMNVPLPRECPFCRIQEKFNLWVKNIAFHPRTCTNCETTIHSKYTEEEAPQVLCKRCYQEIL